MTAPARPATVIAGNDVAAYLALPADTGPEVVLAVLAPHAVRLPIGLCVSQGRLPEQGTSVLVGDGVVSAGGRSWRPARWWDPRPHLDPRALLAHLDLLLDVVGAELPNAYGLPLADAFVVAAGLAAADDDVAARAAHGVLGLGPGLTPSGDDVVAGAFAVLALLGELDDSVRDAVVANSRTRTTALSSALVAAAGRGEMIPQATRLLASVAAGDPRERVASAARSLFDVGSTSGHDLAAGMAGALAAVSMRVAA